MSDHRTDPNAEVRIQIRGMKGDNKGFFVDDRTTIPNLRDGVATVTEEIARKLELKFNLEGSDPVVVREGDPLFEEPKPVKKKLDKVGDLEERNKELEAQLEDFKVKLSFANDEIKALEDSDSGEALKKANDQLDVANKEVERLSGELKEKTKSLDELQQTSDEALKKANEELTAKDAEIASLKEAHAIEVESLNAKITELSQAQTDDKKKK